MGWRDIFPTRSALTLALFVCVVAPVTLVALQIGANPKLSPVDEAAHFDYVDRAASGEIPRQGEPLRAQTLRDVACRGIVLGGTLKIPPCSTRNLEYDQFSLPLQYEAQQPPTYYALTVPLRWATRNLIGISDKLRATRAANIAWLVVGLLMLWGAGRAMAVGPLPLAAALLLLVTSPMVLYTTATVTNDATAVPAAGLVALAAALMYGREGRRTPIVLFSAGFVAGSLKATNSFAVIAVSGLFAVAAISAGATGQGWTKPVRRWLRDGGALLLGALASVAIWAIVHRSLALVDLARDPSFDLLRHDPRNFGTVIREAVQLLEPLTGFGGGGFFALSPDTLGNDVQIPLYSLLAYTLMAAALTALFVSPRRWSHALGAISLVVLYVWGVVLGLGLMLTYNISPGLTGRYGLTVAALLILVLAASVVGRGPERVLASFAMTSFLATFIVMVT